MNSLWKRAALFLSACVIATQSCHLQAQLLRPRNAKVDVAKSSQGMVVAETPLAAEAGRDVLSKGGSAVDAAVTTAFVLAVTWPEAGNIGGGGFMLVAPPEQDPVCINYRETAPGVVNARSFAGWKNRWHPKMAGVPGTVRGLEMAHKKYGKLPWADLLKPAIKLAREGFIVDAHLAFSLNTALTEKAIRTGERYAEFRRVYGHPGNRLWAAGDRLTQPDLAATLQTIADRGASAFYTGDIAAAIVAEMKAGGGLISTQDLRDYRAKISPAVSGNVKGYTLYGAPLPSSGGATVLMQLRMLEALNLKGGTGAFWTSQQVHLMTEVMRRAFRERAAHMGDPSMVKIPEKIYAAGHARKLAEQIDRNVATPSTAIAGDIKLTEGPYESPETTHFSIIDARGMAVSNTYTLEGNFGSHIVVRGAGFLLNNEMGDFNLQPGYTNLTGRIGTPPNLMAPGKRMLSSQSPTIFKKNGKLVLIVGSPGGRTIINSVTQVAVQTLFFGRDLPAAVAGPRFHHQWLPDVLRVEDAGRDLFQPMKDELKGIGHTLQIRKGYRQGSVNAIAIDPATGVATGVADWRRGAAARGVKQIQP